MKYFVVYIWLLFLLLSCFNNLFAYQASLPLRGYVHYLNGTPVTDIQVRISGINQVSKTDNAGNFTVAQRPAGANAKKTLTLTVNLPGYLILYPSGGRISARDLQADQLLDVIVAPQKLVNWASSPKARRKLLNELLMAQSKDHLRIKALGTLSVIRHMAARLRVSVPDLTIFLNEWEKRVTRGNSDEKIMADILEKRYAEAIKALLAVIQRQQKSSRANQAYLANCYTLLGIAYTGKDNIVRAQKAYRSSLRLISNKKVQDLLLETYKYTSNYSRALNLLDIQARKYTDQKTKAARKNYAGVLNEVGKIFEMAGRVDSALVYYKRSLKLESRLKHTEGIANVLRNIGIAYEIMEKPDSAIIYYRKLVSTERKLGRQERLSVAFSQLGSFYEKQGELESALFYYNRSLTLESKLQQSKNSFHLEGNTGLVFEAKGALDSALIYYRNIREIQKIQQRPEILAMAMGGIAKIYHKQGQVDSALVYYRRSLTINRELRHPEGLTLNYSGSRENLLNSFLIVNYWLDERGRRVSSSNFPSRNFDQRAAFYENQGELDSALIYYQKSLNVNQRSQNQKAEAASLSKIANIYQRQGLLGNALDYYKHALGGYQGLQSAKDFSIQLGHIGTIYQSQGFLDSAFVCYQHALKTLRNMNHLEGMAIQLFNMGVLHELKQETKAAIAKYDSARSYFKSLKSPYTAQVQDARLRARLRKDPFWMGHFLAEHKYPREALLAYREALYNHPDSLLGYVYVGNMFSQNNLPDSAVANYQYVLDKISDHAPALNALAWHYALRNEHLQLAKELSERSLKLSSWSPMYWSTLAEVLLRLKEYRNAQVANDKAWRYATDRTLIQLIQKRSEKIMQAMSKEMKAW